MLKFGTQLNLPEESSLENSLSQGHSQRSEEMVEVDTLSEKFSPISGCINIQHKVKNLETVLFSGEKHVKNDGARKNFPQLIPSNFLKYGMKCDEDEKWCTEEMKTEEEMKHNYAKNVSQNHVVMKTRMKSKKSNIQEHRSDVEKSRLCHRDTTGKVKTIGTITKVHPKGSTVKGRTVLKIRSIAGVLHRNHRSDKTATSYDNESSDTCSPSFASDFMC